MEFLFHCALLAWLPEPLGARSFEGGQEGHMRNIHIAGDLQRSAPQEQAALAGDRDAFTPSEFFKDAGTVIVVCLGLGLLMQLVLG
jgi:hypothetical protein